MPKSWYHIRLQLNGCKVNAIVERGDSTELARLNANLESYPLHAKSTCIPTIQENLEEF